MASVGILDSPFNIEAILAADDELQAYWKKRPFLLRLNEEGLMYVHYVTEEDLVASEIDDLWELPETI